MSIETVDITGAADLLKIHPKTALKMIKSGEIPAAKVGRAYVILKNDILNYVENQIITQTAARMRRVTPRKSTRATSPSLSRASLHTA